MAHDRYELALRRHSCCLVAAVNAYAFAVASGDCVYCRASLDGEAPAVLLLGGEASWQPVLSDLRSSVFELAHPTCFVDARGLLPLLEAIQESDRRLLSYARELRERVARLEQR